MLLPPIGNGTSGGRLVRKFLVSQSGGHHGDDVVVGEAGVGAGADHVVHQQLHGAVRSQVGTHGMALGHERPPSV